jgi:hypothetical protein
MTIVTSHTTFVPVSAPQSTDGRVADLDALKSDVPGTAKARRWHGAS